MLRTSDAELKQLVVAWLALTTGFTLLMAPPIQMEIQRIDLGAVATTFAVSLVTAGAGFLLHELAHKVVAQRYGYWAEFRADYEMLALTIASGALGFLFAAPGAVEVRGSRGIDGRANGMIAVAGPATNLALFVVFLSLTLVARGGILSFLASFGALINAFLAAFNMLPYGPLDGAKVLDWSKPVFGVVLAAGAGATVYMLFFF